MNIEQGIMNDEGNPKPVDRCKPLIDENNELISIFVTSIATAQKNLGTEFRLRRK